MGALGRAVRAGLIAKVPANSTQTQQTQPKGRLGKAVKAIRAGGTGTPAVTNTQNRDTLG